MATTQVTNTPKLWILVANQREARIYTRDSVRGPLEEIRRYENAEGDEYERDLVSDRPGRSFDSAGQGRHAMEPQVDAREQEAIRFAREIADGIETGRNDGEIARLVLIAAPAFLGRLRLSLSDSAARLVSDEIAKNLSQFDTDEIQRHLALA